MSPDRIASNIFSVRANEQIPARLGDGSSCMLPNLPNVKVDFSDEGDTLQTPDGTKYYVDKGYFLEEDEAI